MIEAPHYSPAGAQARERVRAARADSFDGTVNEPVLHQAVKAYLDNQRQGTADDQDPRASSPAATRSRGSRRAPAARGRARSARRSGGAAASCSARIPRDYRTDVPAQGAAAGAPVGVQRAGARRTRCCVVERLDVRGAKTKQLAELLGKLGLDGHEGAGAHRRREPNVYLSGAQPAERRR